ncbi:MAG TPA: SpoIVB peptidase S55 domain-containing protein [Blastocatellia bacterium]|nr:SpoIVB peptidase S55 domain-containing protein [Blastocatellia bacterium]
MKQFFLSLLLISLLTGMTGASALGSDRKPALNNANFMPLEDVRPGMKGYGFSVFQGSKPERFEVEILGLLDGMNNPKQSIIIARLGGPLVARTSVFAGMSGSPVYIDGKLVGAVAYAFPFSKEPIAGIQPIKYMVDIFERSEDPAPGTSTRVSFNTLMSSAENGSRSLPEVVTAQVGARAASSAAMIPYVGQTVVPIATPVTFSGIPQSVVDMFASDLKKVGIQPIAGIGGGSSLAPMVPFGETTLAPGSSVSVQLVRGDFTVDAAGTVTYRDGEHIYAFGHPFLASGQTSWPMAESSVVTVIPSLNNSFKLSVGGNLVGSISQDRSTGVFGRLGEQPRMVPVRMKVRTSRNKVEDYNFEIVSDSFLTPLLMKIAMFSAIMATERQVGNQTIKLSGRISVNGQPDIVLDNSFSLPNGASFFAVSAVERPLSIIFNSGFDAIDLSGIDVEISSSDNRSSGMLSRLWIDKTEVRRGESIEIQAFARNDNGAEFVERIPFEIPADAPAGPLVIIIGDGASINQTERSQPSADFVPKDLGQLVRAINKLKKNNRLYMKAIYSGTGAIVNNEEMPTLPPSVLATLGSQRTSGGYTALSVATLAERELPPSQFIVSGQQSITINVVR